MDMIVEKLSSPGSALYIRDIYDTKYSLNYDSDADDAFGPILHREQEDFKDFTNMII